MIDKRLLDERRAGVCMHLTSLPGPYGIGELGRAARDFIDAMRHMQLSVWQFLPIGPTAYGNSPYQPLSTFAGNEMLIDIDDLIERSLLTKAEVRPLSALSSEYCEYGSLIPLKTRLLKTAAGRFNSVASADMQADYGIFLDRNDRAWLHDYALFRILKSRHDERPWQEWLAEYVRRDADSLQGLADAARDQIETIKIVQFLFFEQWRLLREYAHANGVLLFGDMPIYIAGDSADAWANPELLDLDEHGQPKAVAGVPPDYFSEDGQLWGNPLYDWKMHKETGYQWWIDRLRATSELVDLVRIDHFRGFESYWSIPADADTARPGHWAPGPGDAIFAAIAEKLGTLPIIAEDLGVITPEVEGLRDRHALPGMRVLQFEVGDEGFALSDIERGSVCYTGTHDNDTTVGWFRGSPEDSRSEDEIRQTQQAVLALTGGSTRTVHTDLINAAFSTDAFMAIAPMQDFLGLGSDARINTPGKLGGNWRWRLNGAQLSPEFCDNVALMVRKSKRGLSSHGFNE
jgi:4-alpha-glucanotransferase